MEFSEVLMDRAGPIRERIAAHPFVRGIGDGTLPLGKFRFYLCQDYVFLSEYCRVLALAVARGTDLTTMGRFAELLHATLSVEMDLHRGYAAEFGIAREELERTVPAAATRGYTNHLLKVAWSGSLGETAASLLPCQWGYWELAQGLAVSPGRVAEGNRYWKWVEMYSSPEYGELAGWLRRLVDALGKGAGAEDRARMEAHYLVSSRYELMFWEMSWREEGWPV